MSIYNVHLNTLFIHTPKTAGSNMAKIVGGAGHWPIWDWDNYITDLDKVFSFGFVRHPLDRFVSAFFHEPNIVGVERTEEGFRGFVRHLPDKLDPALSYPELKGHDLHHHFLPQWFFLCDRNETGEMEVAVDFVGRFERLHEDWAKVCDRMGVYAVLPEPTNSARHKPYQHYYDDELEAKVRALYERDFEQFGYEGV